jgi:hypothetical protein
LASANGTNERSLEVPMPRREGATRMEDDFVHPN